VNSGEVKRIAVIGALVALGLEVGPGKLRAQVNRWTDLGPEGGRVLSVVVDPQNSSIVYASTLVGVYKSYDRGANWTNSGLIGYIVGLLAINPQDSNTIYAVTLGHNDQDSYEYRVFNSRDGGTTWDEVDAGISGCCVETLEIDPFNLETVYLGTWRGVLKSKNGGRNWEDSSTGLPGNLIVYTLALDPQDRNVLYVAGVLEGTTGSAVFKSLDGAATWKETDAGLPVSPNFGIGQLTIDPTRPEIVYLTGGGRVFKSTDGASSWTAAAGGIQSNPLLGRVAVDPQKPDMLLLADSYGQIYKSTDAGANWTSLSTDLPPASYPGWIAIDPRDSSVMYLATLGSAFKSSDGGAHWAATKSGLRAIPVTSLALAQLDPRTVYAGTDQGLFKSTDAGLDWQAAGNGIKLAYPAESIVALAVDQQTPMNVFAATSGVECGYGAGGVFRSTDGSASWTDTGIVSCMYGLALDPQSPSIVYAATAVSGILKSTDGGQNWMPRNTGLLPSTLPGPPITVVEIDPQRPTTLFAGISVWDGQAHGGLFKSVDGALTWQATALQTSGVPISSVAVDSRNSDTVYAAIGSEGSPGGALWKSSDGGTNWRNLIGSMPVSVYALLIDPRDSMNLYLATDTGVMRSNDGGESWTLVPGSPAFSRVLALDSQDVGVLYAGGLGGLFSTRFCRDRRNTLRNVSSAQPAERADRRRPVDCLDQR
jgi:photosystem II stability/assembly factor-like uncharacterized protein